MRGVFLDLMAIAIAASFPMEHPSLPALIVMIFAISASE
jgi:hypothetical protein